MLGPVEIAEARKWLAGDQDVLIPDHVKQYLKEKEELLDRLHSQVQVLQDGFTKAITRLRLTADELERLRVALNLIFKHLEERDEEIYWGTIVMLREAGIELQPVKKEESEGNEAEDIEVEKL